MIFSVNYKSSHKQEAEEIKCPYNQLGVLWAFIKDHPEKRYNIIVPALEDRVYEQLNILKDSNYNFTVESGSLQTTKTLLAEGYPVYSKFPVTDWESFNILKELGVTDIYIDGPLCFQIDKVKAASADIKTRVSPSMSPSASIASRPAPSSFFIRPEDKKYYESAIDVFDFTLFALADKNDTLYQIYRRGTFYYGINQLITGLESSALNPFIPKEFAEARLNCGQRCQTPGSHCQLCGT